MKAFADDKLKMIQMAKSVLDKMENIVGKEENAGYQHFLLFQQWFQKASSSGSLKVWIVWERGLLNQQANLNSENTVTYYVVTKSLASTLHM